MTHIPYGRRQMAGFRYIGSKARIAGQILDLVGPRDGGVFVDAMCGSGAVAREAADRGWPVRVNDHLASAVFTTWGRLARREDVPFSNLGSYHDAVNILNGSQPESGFVWAHYSPASLARGDGVERRYFTEKNAARIDAVRRTIGCWATSGRISGLEERLLIADLLGAANRVANTAGTYGCFLRQWAPNSLRPMVLLQRALREGDDMAEISLGDVANVPIGPTDTAYFDPPYTKRQYAAYYHVLETIALADEPQLEGATGLRPWKHLASAFSYRSRALEAIIDMVTTHLPRRTFLSYSAQGHVSIAQLHRELAATGSVRIHGLGDVLAYRPNRGRGLPGGVVSEFLVEYRATRASAESVA